MWRDTARFSILQTILSAVRRGGFRLAADPSGRFTYEPPTRYTVTERERAEQPRHDAEPPSARALCRGSRTGAH
jgi:hypothetical protein